MTTKEDRIFTNHLLMDELDFWDELSVKSLDDDETREFYDSIVDNIDQQLEAAVEWLSSDDAREYFFEEGRYQEEIFEALEDEWEEILNNNYESIDDLLDTLYSKGKEKGYADMKEHIRYTDTDRLALNFLRGYNLGLIRKLHNDVKYQVKNEIFEGMLKGEHPDTIAPKILNIAGEQLKGSTFSPRQRATLIARTETSRAQNTGILQSYVNEGFTEVKILTAEDDNVCYTCLRYAYEFNSEDKVIYSNAGEERVHNIFELLKGGSFPPFHPLCRCTYTCVTETRGEIQNNCEVIDLVNFNSNLISNQFIKTAIQEYNELKNNPNIKITSNVKVNFDIDDLNNDELFIQYYFREENITIYKSINGFVPVNLVLNYYNNLPKKLTSNCKKIVLSNQSIIKGKKYVPGFTTSNSLDTINILKTPDLGVESVKKTLIHELAHTLDGKNYKYSMNEKYINAFNEDLQRLENKGIFTENQLYVSPYSKEFTTNALNNGVYSHRAYSEDFAESIVEYFLNSNRLFQVFPKKSEYINNILKKY